MKMLATKLWIGFSLIAVLAGCYRNDTRILTFDVPGLKSEDCAAILQQAMGKIEGIEAAEADIGNRKLTVTFNGLKLATKNVEYVIAGAGFDVNDTTAPQQARNNLPEGCR